MPHCTLVRHRNREFAIDTVGSQESFVRQTWRSGCLF